MIKYFILISILLLSKGLLGQATEPLAIQVETDGSQNDSFSIYKITINNYSDSVTCILRSPFIWLGIGQGPIQLIPVETDAIKGQFNLEYAAKDHDYILEVALYRAAIILPYSALYFQIRVPASDKEQYLTIEYFNMYDLNYRQFGNSMKQAWWFAKYHLNERVVGLPARKEPKTK